MTVAFHELLDETAQRAFGITEPAPLAMADRVHHDDLDTLMHVNNTRYFVWFERLRIHVMSHYGIGTLDNWDGPRIVLRGGEVRFIEEMLNGETYVVTTRVSRFRNTSFTVDQAIWSAGRKRATFEAVMVLLTQDGAGRVPLSDAVKQTFLAEGAIQDG
ncbi:MAG: acyl-CoA thioesterase [Rhodobacteraceae bacterium]|nr:acyl-CoA thioesterase [Paracoccaceae bacterium]